MRKSRLHPDPMAATGRSRDKAAIDGANLAALDREIRAALALGAAAVQLGTPFAVTEESAAHPVFKRVLAEARPEDIVAFTSVAGLPARAVRTP